jgi:hypothetical protein
MDTIFDKINKIYSKQTYFDQYNGSVLMTVLLCISFLVAISYAYVKIYTIPIKNNWPAYRCSPLVMPFAGPINAPPGTSQFNYTSENFSNCIYNILREITGYALEPINNAANIFNHVIQEFVEAINIIRNLVSSIRNKFMAITKEILGRLLNILIPIQHLFIKIKAMLGKAYGTLVGGLFTVFGTYMTLKAAMGAIYEFIIIILFALAAIIISLFAGFFSIPVALVMMVPFMAILVIMIIVAVIIKDAFNIRGSGLPGIPSCFKKGTRIDTLNGMRNIENITVGTKLKNNTYVTAVFECDATKETMYEIDGIVVSSKHGIIWQDEWIPVKDHPHAVKCENFEDKTIYCINTSNKKIRIKNYIFHDWDEMVESDYRTLSKKLEKKITQTNLFSEFETGFHGSVVMSGKEIRDIKVNDILDCGSKVTAIVKIDGTKIKTFNYGIIKAGKKIKIANKNLGIKTLEELFPIDYKIHKKESILYHLVTNTGFFKIKNTTFLDYNSNIDYYLSL